MECTKAAFLSQTSNDNTNKTEKIRGMKTQTQKVALHHKCLHAGSSAPSTLVLHKTYFLSYDQNNKWIYSSYFINTLGTTVNQL